MNVNWKKILPLLIIIGVIAIVFFATWSSDNNGEKDLEIVRLERQIQALETEISRLDSMVYELEQRVFELEMELGEVVLLASHEMHVYSVTEFEFIEPGRIDAILGVDIIIGDVVETAGGNYMVVRDEGDSRGFSGLYIGPVEAPQI